MKVACCFSGNLSIPQKCNEFLKVFDDVQYFHYDDPTKTFERNIEKLAIDKQHYELYLLKKTQLQTLSFFDVCVYINTHLNFDNHDLQFKGCNKNTIYTLSDYTEKQPKVFDLFTQYNVSKDFFYCDSKTFNTIGLFGKFGYMTQGMYTVPQETFFYSFIQNMGIENRSLIND